MTQCRRFLHALFTLWAFICLGSSPALSHSPEIYGAHPLHGNFLVSGVDANGQNYRGEVTIFTAGDKLLVHWSIGTQTIKGQGKVDGDRLVVHANFGRHGPTFFQIKSHDLLVGRWDNGKARENLSRRNFRTPHEGRVATPN